MLNIFYIIIAMALVLLNAFFVAAEFAMVKLRNTRLETIKQAHGFRGVVLERIHDHLDAYLSACQLGITLASLGLGWVGEPAFAELLQPLFHAFGVFSHDTIQVISFFIAFTFLSFLHIVLGELVPKSLALRQSEKISLWTAVPLYVFYWLMYPAIWFLNSCAVMLLKIFKLDEYHSGEFNYSSEELKLILSTTHLHNDLTRYEVEILKHTLDFADLQVTDVMRPIEEMVAIEISQSIDEMLEVILKTRYSRYPVYEEDPRQLIGILHVKDLFAALYRDKNISNIRPLLRPLLKVPHHLPSLQLLQRFREGMPHFAVVYSGIENPIGFVTLDNLLQVLVGRIRDEFHKTDQDVKIAPDGSFILKGNTPIYTLEGLLRIDIFASEEETTTLAGLILDKTGAVPKAGERIEFDNFIVVIEKTKGPRILLVRVYPK